MFFNSSNVFFKKMFICIWMKLIWFLYWKYWSYHIFFQTNLWLIDWLTDLFGITYWWVNNNKKKYKNPNQSMLSLIQIFDILTQKYLKKNNHYPFIDIQIIHQSNEWSVKDGHYSWFVNLIILSEYNRKKPINRYRLKHTYNI